MPYANHDGIHIHYEVEGTGRPLVLQHGFTGNLKRWYQFGYVEALKPNYRVILVDARGHGASDKPHDAAAYALSLRVGDVLAVLDSLNLDKAHYWGYSMGGWIGFGMAKYAPERVHSLIIGGAHPYEQRLPASSRLDGSDPDAFVAALLGRLDVNAAAIPPGLREELFANDFRALAAAQQDRPSLEDVLPMMTMPCCLYASDADPLYPKARECVQRIPHATFFSLQGLDHSAAFRDAGLALPHVTEFLQGVTEATKEQPNHSVPADGGFPPRLMLTFGSKAVSTTPEGRGAMKMTSLGVVLSLGVMSPAFGQQMSAGDQEMMKVRQAMTEQYAAAVAKKDAVAMADHYTVDVITAGLCPETPPVVGREAKTKQAEATLKAGFRDYSGKVKEVRLLSDGTAWSTGISEFTINGKDGTPVRARGNWMDILRREGKECRVSF